MRAQKTALPLRALSVVDFIVTILFIIEMLLKLIALVFMHKGAYARDAWNNLDGFLVSMSIVGLILNHLSKKMHR